MSTGATDDDLAFAGGGLSEELIARIVGTWNYLEKDGAVPYGALIRAAWNEIIDAARVPTDDELAAMNRVLINASQRERSKRSDINTMLAYLERQR